MSSYSFAVKNSNLIITKKFLIQPIETATTGKEIKFDFVFLKLAPLLCGGGCDADG
jgi:hypothetical protein